MLPQKARYGVLLLNILSLALAHVLLKTPVPYGAKTLDTNPLLKSGSDYPCKQREGVYGVSQWNIMSIGQPQVMSFQGMATHGGGSCQISLTADTPPTKKSVFKVIKSIEGGCPSAYPGNVGDSPIGSGADNFTYSIPSSIPSDKNYTLAFTWFNKIGDREMYMNCAPIFVTASTQQQSLSEKQEESPQSPDSMESLPVMFRANIGDMGNGCATAPSGTVLAIPKENLGENVQRIGTEPLVPPVGECGGSYGADMLAPSPAAGQPSESQNATLVSASTTDASSVSSFLSTPPTAETNTAKPSPSRSSPPSSPYPSQNATVPTSTSGFSLTRGTCPSPGKSVCSPDGTAWGTCDEHHSVLYQKVASGTKCDPALGVEVPARRNRLYRGWGRGRQGRAIELFGYWLGPDGCTIYFYKIACLHSL